jgi:hypothetical protein
MGWSSLDDTHPQPEVGKAERCREADKARSYHQDLSVRRGSRRHPVRNSNEHALRRLLLLARSGAPDTIGTAQVLRARAKRSFGRQALPCLCGKFVAVRFLL